MDRDNYARLMREAAAKAAESNRASMDHALRMSFLEGVGFAGAKHRVALAKLIKIRKLAATGSMDSGESAWLKSLFDEILLVIDKEVE